MKVLISLFLGLSLLPQAGLAGSKLISSLTINGEQTKTVDPEMVQEWRFQFFDRVTNEKIVDFRPWHTRDMHLLLIKKDYSSFAHVHADVIGKTGIFTTILNQTSHDPDNQQAVDAIRSPGEYYVISEISPLERQKYSISEIVRQSITASGTESYKDFLLDPVLGHTSDHDHPPHHNPGTLHMEKFFSVKGLPDPDRPWRTPGKFEILPGTFGDMYKVELNANSTKGCGGNLIQFFLIISKWDDMKGNYSELTSIDPWLGMSGHVIFMEYAPGKSLEDLDFVHVHGMQHDNHPAIEFVHFDRSIMNGKKYRAWFQVKTIGKIHTFPFSFEWMDSYQNGNNCK